MADSAGTLYRDVILEHSRNPRNATPVDPADFLGRAHNPLCGDELELTLALEHGVIGKIGIQVRGCAISQAAASLMSEAIVGMTLEEARVSASLFKFFLEGHSTTLPKPLATLTALEAIRSNASRLNCAMLPWQALQSGAPK